MQTENEWASCCDSSCTNEGGVCQDKSNYCSSRYTSGLCEGPSDRQCCGGLFGECFLRRYCIDKEE